MSRSSLRRWAGPAIAGSLALVGSVLPVLAGAAHAVPGTGSPVFINELHYDDAGADAGEFVEIAGPTGTDLTGWRVVPYNGSNGAAYTPVVDLTGVIPAAQVLAFDLVGMQNGAPDALALVDASGRLVQLLSYEGAFTGVGGAADGRLSTDIGVSEVGTEPDGLSLQLTGTGAKAEDFTWTGPLAATRGTLNAGQVLTAPGAPAAPVTTCVGTLRAAVGTATTTTVSATDADSRFVSAGLTEAPTGISLEGFAPSTADGRPGSGTLTVAADAPRGTSRVEVVFSTDDTPAQTAKCTVEVVVSDTTRVTPVSQVQGPGEATPLLGQDVVVEAVVTSLITSQDVLNGFFVQDEAADGDGDARTSEGVYVFCGTRCPSGLAAGDLVRVTGRADEFSGSTQVNASRTGTSITEVGTAPLPTAAVITLPAGGSTRDAKTFEHLEGMRTTISTTLAVSEYFNLARFGEIVLTAEERSYQYTQVNAPSVAGYAAFQAELATRRIVLDDDSNDQNDATSGPVVDEPYSYPTPGLSTDNSFRGGDTITGLTGVLEYSFGAWKLRPVAGADYAFTTANPRPTSPDDVGGRLEVASFNVLNYFATVDATPSDDNGPCGPSGTDDCRGADSEAERVRQLDKIVAALSTIRADVFGLIEIQNDTGRATQQIVDALNAKVGAGTYDYVRTGVIGTDAIKQAFLFNTKTVEPVGRFDLLTSADDPRFVDTRNRPSLIQTFDEVLTGERLTVSVNHLKSKGSGCGTGDDSPLDGSGNCDGTRTNAAQALVDHLEDDPTGSGDPDFLIIGDLNSYARERPIQAIEGAGYTNLLRQFEGEDSYGYLFDGLLGDLDHALASTSLLPQVTGAGGWDINADENPLFDYNDTVKDDGEAAFERESAARPLYEADAYRSSDHDPAIVGLALTSPNRAPVARITGPTTVRVGRTIQLDAGTSSDPNRLDVLSYAWDLDGDGEFDDATGTTATFRGVRGPGARLVAVQVTDGRLTAVARTTVTVTVK